MKQIPRVGERTRGHCWSGRQQVKQICRVSEKTRAQSMVRHATQEFWSGSYTVKGTGSQSRMCVLNVCVERAA